MSNVADQLEHRLTPSELDLLRRASRVSGEQRVALYLVGGSVRDMLVGSRPGDIDLVGDGADAPFASALAGALGGDVLARSQFETFKLRIGEVDVDLAAARRESYARPGALPTVTPGSIDEDLGRRDFSINAMAISLGDENWGDLLDPHGGRRDLDRGLVRVLRAGSFADDPTRILRAVRYAHRLDFRIEQDTERQLEMDVGHLSAVTGERIRHELERIFKEPRAVDILVGAQELGVLEAIHPALAIVPGLPEVMAASPTDPELPREKRLLALLAYAVPSEVLGSLVERLSMDRDWASVVRDVGVVRDAFDQLGAEGLRPSKVHALLKDLDPASVEGCALATSDALVGERLELYLRELRHVKPVLNGDDLLGMGVPEGPEVGRLLDKILEARLEGLLSTRDDEENLARRSLRDAD